MECPKNHGEMFKYDESPLKEKYVCRICDLKLEKDTKTGKVVAIVGIAATVLAAIMGLS